MPEPKINALAGILRLANIDCRPPRIVLIWHRKPPRLGQRRRRPAFAKTGIHCRREACALDS